MLRSVLTSLAFAALVVGLAPTTARAQQRCTFLCAPTFLSQTGLIITNAIDPPEGASSNTDLNLRFTTVIPTAAPRLSLVALFQWQPTEDANVPAIVYGGVITLLRPTDTGGWLGVSFNPLGVFSPNADPEIGEDNKAYTHKLDLEGELDLHVFNKLPPENWFHGVSIYGLLDYIATGLPDGADPWVILTGLNIPLAPWRS